MKRLFSFVLFLTTILFVSPAFAHPGKLDKNGGHTCYTNCAKWGLKDGEYHYHDKNGNIIKKGQSNNNKKPTAPEIKINSKHTVKVIRVVDGDTIEVKFSTGATAKVRLIGVNTPETVAPNRPVEKYGKEASNYTKKRLTNKTVTLEFDVGIKDKYGRLLAYVWVGKELYNETLVKEGYARVMTIQPNVKYQEKFIKAERAARQSKKGLWR
ncbi:micrococcal nuclease [Anoxybacillus tepidamans]|uniref:Micrococcal nuclease n=1 Tax=Anoxybacteroides tepidamans TaxID=265948 RepID=A0A7W8MX23_9BACL|nr:thermonuclease family protein [Anoxybacillus tepidamans]MBB5325215.1 micrococcal nuclease [Anoxybacillus tepidamans]